MDNRIECKRIVDDATAAGLTLEHVGDGYVQGSAGNWQLTSRGGLWAAKPILGWGMPIAHAVYLHEMPLPGAKFGLRRQIAGQVIRTEGCAGAPHPAEYCGGRPTITRYHIDTVAGLRIFVDYVTRPGLADAVIESVCPYWMVDESEAS